MTGPLSRPKGREARLLPFFDESAIKIKHFYSLYISPNSSRSTLQHAICTTLPYKIAFSIAW